MGKYSFLHGILSKEQIKEVTRDIPRGQKGKFADFLHTKYEEAIKEIPKIAIIGKTGVGKSSTLNALFGTDLEVHDVRPSTKIPAQINFQYERAEGSKGELYFYDMPGVGETAERDKEHIAIYQDVLADCDLAVWVLEAENRAMTFDERFLREFFDNKKTSLKGRLVVAINKVDIMPPPDGWNYQYNVPSPIQKQNIQERLLYVQEILADACPWLTPDRFVAYSATQHYHLVNLFDAMIRAIPRNRAWILNNVKDIARYIDKVDPRVREDPEINRYLTAIIGG